MILEKQATRLPSPRLAVWAVVAHLKHPFLWTWAATTLLGVAALLKFQGLGITSQPDDLAAQGSALVMLGLILGCIRSLPLLDQLNWTLDRQPTLSRQLSRFTLVLSGALLFSSIALIPLALLSVHLVAPVSLAIVSAHLTAMTVALTGLPVPSTLRPAALLALAWPLPALLQSAPWPTNHISNFLPGLLHTPGISNYSGSTAFWLAIPPILLLMALPPQRSPNRP